MDTLLIDGDAGYAERMIRGLKSRGLRLQLVHNAAEALPILQGRSVAYGLVIIDISDISQPWLTILDQLKDAGSNGGTLRKPSFLCISNRHLDARFELEIERKGARFVHDEIQRVIEKVDLLLAELREIRSAGPRFRILHRFGRLNCPCEPGEEIVGVFLVHRTREIAVTLSVTSRLLFDYLARHRHLPQNASQIAAGMGVDPFYCRHGTRGSPQGDLIKTISRTSVKEFIKRTRLALERAFLEAHLDLDPEAVLVSEDTFTNEVGYRLRATVELVHIDDQRRGSRG